MNASKITLVSFQDGGRWFVHGITVDYCASGETQTDALIQFWSGLAMTFWKTQLEKGTVKSLMRPAPREIIEGIENILGRPIASISEGMETIQ